MAWSTPVGNIKGPQGEPGPQGDQGPQGSPGTDGTDGRSVTGAYIRESDGFLVIQFSSAPTEVALGDVTGEDGRGVEIAGTVATYADLPASANPGDGYLVDADGLLYVYDGTTFPAQGNGFEFRGETGRGITNAVVDASGNLIISYSDGSPDFNAGHVVGADGLDGATGPEGPEGPQGPAGTDGTNGADGERGTGWYSASGTPAGKTLTPTPKAGDHYLDLSTGDVYKFV